jgi:oxygen-independent coproporphyrinogen-3 oxidase
MDLIYGLPNQTKSAWQKDLTRAVELQPEHLACYMLTYESGTPLDQARRHGRITPLNEKTSARLLKLTRQFLSTHDYVQYEISNFARSDNGNPEIYRSHHNLKYWNKVPYLGLGPSAHSYEHPVRWWNLAQVEDYIKSLNAGRLPVVKQERLNRDQQIMETLYLGLRQTAGIDVVDFGKTFGVDFRKHFGAPLEEMMEEGVLTITNNRCALTPKGMRLLDSVVSRLV